MTTCNQTLIFVYVVCACACKFISLYVQITCGRELEGTKKE